MTFSVRFLDPRTKKAITPEALVAAAVAAGEVRTKGAVIDVLLDNVDWSVADNEVAVVASVRDWAEAFEFPAPKAAESSIHVMSSGGVCYSGPDAVKLYKATVLKSAIQLYAKARIKPNAAYTPTRMLETAGAITGKTFRRGEYGAAILALDNWIAAARDAIPVTRS